MCAAFQEYRILAHATNNLLATDFCLIMEIIWTVPKIVWPEPLPQRFRVRYELGSGH